MKLLLILLCFLSLKANVQGQEKSHENFISVDSIYKLHPLQKSGTIYGEPGAVINVIQPDTAFIPPNIHFIKIDGKIFEIKRNIELVEVQPHIDFNQWWKGIKIDTVNLISYDWYMTPDNDMKMLFSSGQPMDSIITRLNGSLYLPERKQKP